MLKKVMIICLALSFVLVGGIGIVLAGDCNGTQKYDVDKLRRDGSCQDFISNDSSIIIAKRTNCPIECDRCEHRRPNCSRQDFTSSDSSIIIADAGGPEKAGDCPAPNSHDGVNDNGPGWPILGY